MNHSYLKKVTRKIVDFVIPLMNFEGYFMICAILMVCFRYQASNGIERGETGILRGEKNKPILQVIGYYSYPNDDGTIVKKAYLANEDGFRLYNLESQSYLPPTPGPAPIPTRVISTLQGGGIG